MNQPQPAAGGRDEAAPARSSEEKFLSLPTKSQPACDQNSERHMKPLTRIQQEAIKLRKIRLNQPPVTYEQAMKQFEEHRKAAQESGTSFHE
jgi:hypothetical protein